MAIVELLALLASTSNLVIHNNSEQNQACEKAVRAAAAYLDALAPSSRTSRRLSSSSEFIFTSPTFLPDDVTDKVQRERREFHIPRIERERSVYGTDYEIRLRNMLTQRAVLRNAPSGCNERPSFVPIAVPRPCRNSPAYGTTESRPLLGFTAVDLGYQPGDAVANIVNNRWWFRAARLHQRHPRDYRDERPPRAKKTGPSRSAPSGQMPSPTEDRAGNYWPQNPVPARACRFKSGLRYFLRRNDLRRLL
jgi:hypothetical protein